MPGRPLIGVVICLCLTTGARGVAAQQREATVMIRMEADVTVTLPASEWESGPTEQRPGERFSGSGFLVSPDGYVLTSSHVLHPTHLTNRRDITDIEAPISEMSVRRLEVVLPHVEAVAHPHTLYAVLVADDPIHDLAVLRVQGPELPYLVLSDSSGLSPGEPVAAWGFPQGDWNEYVTSEGLIEPPPVTAFAGNVLTIKTHPTEGLPADVPYLQVTTPFHPGNSGGPVTDRDGYVVGMAQAGYRDPAGHTVEALREAIAVDEIKRFLDRNGLSTILPVVRLSPGIRFDLPTKGLRFELPVEFADTSASRLALDSGPSLAPIALLVDRIHTPWDLLTLERALLDGRTFRGGLPGTLLSDRPQRWRPEQRSKTGLAQLETDKVGRMLYAIVDLGAEKVVARYVGPSDDVAYNFGILRESLKSLSATPLMPRPLRRPLEARLATSFNLPESAPVRRVPVGFSVDYLFNAVGCDGVAAPSGGLSALLDGDFTVQLRAVWWSSDVEMSRITAACLGPNENRLRRSSVLYDVPQITETVVRSANGRPVLLQFTAPEEKVAFVEGAFESWIDSVSAAQP